MRFAPPDLLMGFFETKYKNPDGLKTYTLETGHETTLVLDEETGRATHINTGLQTRSYRYRSVHFLMNPRDSGFGFLVSPRKSQKVSVVGDAWDGSILSYRVIKDAASQSIVLRHPQTGLFLCAEPLESAASEALTATASGKRPGATFRLKSVAHSAFKKPIEDIHRRLPRLEPDGLKNLLLTNQNIDGEAFQAFCRLLSHDDLRVLAGLILDDTGTFSPLQRLFPQGKWALESASHLNSHIQERLQHRDIIPCNRELDWLARSSEKDDSGGLPQMLNRITREATTPRSTACLLTCVRNEGIYLVEWIAYHRILGFDHIFVYSNDNTDGSDLLLERLAKNGLITWLPNTVGPGVAPQYKAYGHALKILPDVLDYEWMALTDVDEFIVLDREEFSSLNEFLSFHRNLGADSVSLRWRMIGGANATLRNEELITQRFTQSFQDNCPLLKSIFRPKLFSHANPHVPARPYTTDASYVLSSGEKHRDDPHHESDKFSHAWINHYYFKSIEEALVRRSQNRGDEALSAKADPDRISDHTLDWMFSVHDGQLSTSQSENRQSVEGLEAEVNRILSLEGIREAYEIANSGYMALLHDLQKAMQASSRFNSGNTLARRAREIIAESVSQIAKRPPV